MAPRNTPEKVFLFLISGGRRLFLEFVFSLFEFGDKACKRECCQLGSIFDLVFAGFGNDDREDIEFVLGAIEELILKDDYLKIIERTAMFNVKVLARLLAFYEEGEKEKVELVHQFLVSICTQPGYGLCYRDEGWYLADLQRSNTETVDHSHKRILHNIRLLRFLEMMSPLKVMGHRNLIVKILAATPELFRAYWQSYKNSLEPRLSSNWLASISMLQRSLLHSIPPMRATPPLHWLAMDNLAPQPAIVRATLVKMLQNHAPLVKLKGLELIHAILIRLGRALDSYHQAGAFQGNHLQWKEAAEQIKLGVRQRLPDFQAILAIYTSSDHEMLEKVVLGVIQQCQQIMPEVLAEEKFSVDVLIPGNIVHLSPIRQLHIIKMLQSSEFRWSGHAKNAEQSHLRNLIDLYLKTNHQKLREHLLLVFQYQMSKTGLFEHDELEVPVWLHALYDSIFLHTGLKKNQICSILAEFLDSCLQKFHLQTYKYYDMVVSRIEIAKKKLQEYVDKASELHRNILEQELLSLSKKVVYSPLLCVMLQHLKTVEDNVSVDVISKFLGLVLLYLCQSRGSIAKVFCVLEEDWDKLLVLPFFSGIHSYCGFKMSITGKKKAILGGLIKSKDIPFNQELEKLIGSQITFDNFLQFTSKFSKATRFQASQAINRCLCEIERQLISHNEEAVFPLTELIRHFISQYPEFSQQLYSHHCVMECFEKLSPPSIVTELTALACELHLDDKAGSLHRISSAVLDAFGRFITSNKDYQSQLDAFLAAACLLSKAELTSCVQAIIQANDIRHAELLANLVGILQAEGSILDYLDPVYIPNLQQYGIQAHNSGLDVVISKVLRDNFLPDQISTNISNAVFERMEKIIRSPIRLHDPEIFVQYVCSNPTESRLGMFSVWIRWDSRLRDLALRVLDACPSDLVLGPLSALIQSLMNRDINTEEIVSRYSHLVPKWIKIIFDGKNSTINLKELVHFIQMAYHHNTELQKQSIAMFRNVAFSRPEHLELFAMTLANTKNQSVLVRNALKQSIPVMKRHYQEKELLPIIEKMVQCCQEYPQQLKEFAYQMVAMSEEYAHAIAFLVLETMEPASLDLDLLLRLDITTFSDSHLERLINKILTVMPTQTISLSVIEKFTPLYQARCTKRDTLILSLFYHYELAYSKTLMGTVNFWGAKSSLQTGRFLEPNTFLIKCCRAIRSRKMMQTIREFPADLALHPAVIDIGDTYDPRFFVPLVANLLTFGNQIEIWWLLGSNLLGLCVAALSSESVELRRAGYYVLDEFYALLQTARFREKKQVELIFDWLRNSIEDRDTPQRLCSITTAFVAYALPEMLVPDGLMYAQLNKYFLARHSADLQVVPMFYDTFNSTAVDGGKEREWLFSLLTAGIKTSRDYPPLQRRHVIELLCSHYRSAVSSDVQNSLTLKIIRRCCKDSLVGTYLVHNNSILIWIIENIASDSHLADMLEIATSVLGSKVSINVQSQIRLLVQAALSLGTVNEQLVDLVLAAMKYDPKQYGREVDVLVEMVAGADPVLQLKVTERLYAMVLQTAFCTPHTFTRVLARMMAKGATETTQIFKLIR